MYKTIKQLIYIIIFSVSLISHAEDKHLIVNDITQLNPITVKASVAPQTLDELINTIKNSTGSISIGGGRYSHGGQTSHPDSLHLDIRQFNQVISLDLSKKEIKVQAGITWRDLQEYIDPHHLSLPQHQPSLQRNWPNSRRYQDWTLNPHWNAYLTIRNFTAN